MSSDCMIPGSDEFRLDELDELIATEKVKLTSLRLRERALCDRIEKLSHERKELCPHVLTTTTSEYYRGGYDYTGHTSYKTTCNRCDTTVKSWEKSDGRYG